jgi:hypothetical protein
VRESIFASTKPGSCGAGSCALRSEPVPLGCGIVRRRVRSCHAVELEQDPQAGVGGKGALEWPQKSPVPAISSRGQVPCQKPPRHELFVSTEDANSIVLERPCSLEEPPSTLAREIQFSAMRHEHAAKLPTGSKWDCISAQRQPRTEPTGVAKQGAAPATDRTLHFALPERLDALRIRHPSCDGLRRCIAAKR